MKHPPTIAAALVACLSLVACGGGDADQLPQLSAAQAAPLSNCTALTSFSFAGTTVTAASVVAAGTLTNAGQPVGEHCLVTGRMNDRVSSVDGQTYAIGFQMRLPKDWNGRFLHQGNGGTDGVVVVADKASRTGAVVGVMDQCRLAGAKDVSLAASRSEGGQ